MHLLLASICFRWDINCLIPFIYQLSLQTFYPHLILTCLIRSTNTNFFSITFSPKFTKNKILSTLPSLHFSSFSPLFIASFLYFFFRVGRLGICQSKFLIWNANEAVKLKDLKHIFVTGTSPEESHFRLAPLAKGRRGRWRSDEGGGGFGSPKRSLLIRKTINGPN